MNKYWEILPWTLWAAFPAAAVAAPLPPIGTFIYSRACVTTGGDFSGYRVTLRRGAQRVKAVIDFNDSGPKGHADARNLKFDPLSGKLSFSFQGIDLKYVFQGFVSQSQLLGTVDAMEVGRRSSVSIGHDEIKLPLVKSLPKQTPDCE